MNQVINIPDGFELKKVSETEYKIVPKERRLPKTWEEFCKINNRLGNDEYYITNDSGIVKAPAGDRYVDSDKNVCPSKEIAEGILALMQLIQLRDYYNDGWKPEGNVGSALYYFPNKGQFNSVMTCEPVSPLVFKSTSIATEFYHNFKDLLDKVKYLF